MDEVSTHAVAQADWESLLKQIDFSADYVEYHKREGKITMRGNVTIRDKNITLTCQQAIVDLTEEKIEAAGKVILQDQETILYGSHMIYDSKTGRGTIEEGSSFIDPWYCYGEKIERINDKEIIVENGYVTTCELSSPHYRLTAKRIRILLEEKISAYNVLMYVGKVPVFYFPFYFRSLKEKKFLWGVKLGSSREEGFFALIFLTYVFNKQTRATLLLDYMTRKGFGWGTRFAYGVPDTLKGSLYGYYIKEKDTGKKRWRVEGEHWQNLGSSFYLQTKLDYMSDWEFNRIYNEEDWIPMTEELKSHIALVRTKPSHNIRIVAEKKDVWPLHGTKFVNIHTYSPEVSFSTNLLQISRGFLYYRWGASYANLYSRPFDYTTRKLDGDGHSLNQAEVYLDLVNRFFISGVTGMDSEIGLKEKWQDKDEDWERKHIFTNIYHTKINLRTRPTRYLDTDLTHSFQHDQREGTTLNKLSLLQRIRLLWLLEFRSFSGYSFIGEKKGRFDNLFSEIEFSPSDLWNFYLGHSYDLNGGGTSNFQAEAIIGPGGTKWSINARLTYLAGTEDVSHSLDIVNGFNFSLGEKWVVRARTRYDIYGRTITERAIHLSRDLHCWEVKVSWSKIPREEEVWVTVNLKAFPEEKIGLYHNVQEKEWRLRRR